MNGLRKRIEALEDRTPLEPDEEYLRYKLALEALARQDRELFRRYPDMIETHPRLDWEDVALSATPEESAAYARLLELEALPLEELRRLAA